MQQRQKLSSNPNIHLAKAIPKLKKAYSLCLFLQQTGPKAQFALRKWANWRESCVVRIFGRDLEQSVFPVYKCAARFRKKVINIALEELFYSVLLLGINGSFTVAATICKNTIFMWIFSLYLISVKCNILKPKQIYISSVRLYPNSLGCKKQERWNRVSRLVSAVMSEEEIDSLTGTILY